MASKKKKTAEESLPENQSSISSCYTSSLESSQTPKTVSKNSILEFKKIFNDQIQTEYMLLDRCIDNAFNQAIEALEGCGMADTIVTPVCFPPGCSLGNGLKNVISTFQSIPIVHRSYEEHPNPRQSRPENVRLRRSARNKMSTRPSNPRSSKCLSPRRQRATQIATVTPLAKRAPTILRKPRPGETVISMYGSPLHVSSDDVSTTSLVVPLNDGRIFTLEQDANFSFTKLPDDLDMELVGSLISFKNYLSRILK